MTANGETEERSTAAPDTGAPPRRVDHWHAINWRKVHETVRRLQARIVKATKAGRHGKAKALQWLLTHSFSARAEAVKRVQDNHGKNTPGVDRVIWDTPEKKMDAVRNTGRRRNYRPQPLRRIYIPKNSNPTKLRPLGIPCMVDRAEQALHLLALDPIAETIQDHNSYGFRRERSAADALQECYIVLAKKVSPPYVLEGDIEKCFDKISSEWLEQHIPMDRVTLSKWLKAGYIEAGVLHPTNEGTPQGGIASPVLANLALDGMEKILQQTFWSTYARRRKTKVNLIRYADDFIVTGATREILEQEVMPLLKAFLTERGLTLSAEKTIITHIDEGFDFLGCHVRKRTGKFFIEPAKKNIKALMTKIRSIINKNKQNTAGQLIVQLNPLLRGWGNYYQPWMSKRIFNEIDNELYHCIWRWACQRHPTQKGTWLKATYFKRAGNYNWTFSGEVESKNGLRPIHLFRMATIPIQRHVKIKGEANPYDPEWEYYFERRFQARTKKLLMDRMDLQILWSRQSGICPMCGQVLRPEESWERHHVMWRTFGGDDTLENLRLLHATCHRQLHHREGKAVIDEDLSPGRTNGLGEA